MNKMAVPSEIKKKNLIVRHYKNVCWDAKHFASFHKTCKVYCKWNKRLFGQRKGTKTEEKKEINHYNIMFSFQGKELTKINPFYQ